MTDQSLIIDRTDMSLADLVFSGADGTPLGLIDLIEPALIPRTEYASSGRFIDGSIAVASTWDLTAIVATVELEYTTAGALKTAVDEVKAAMKRITFQSVITKNGGTTTWQSQGRGGLALANGSVTRWDLERTTEIYRLTIPVHPVPIS